MCGTPRLPLLNDVCRANHGTMDQSHDQHGSERYGASGRRYDSGQLATHDTLVCESPQCDPRVSADHGSTYMAVEKL